MKNQVQDIINCSSQENNYEIGIIKLSKMTIWTNVKSSNIEALSHSAEELLVKFKSGKVYKYANVQVELFQQIRDAESVGKIFNQKIKSFPNTFPFTLT